MVLGSWVYRSLVSSHLFNSRAPDDGHNGARNMSSNNTFCNKKTNLLHLVGLLFPRKKEICLVAEISGLPLGSLEQVGGTMFLFRSLFYENAGTASVAG